MEWSIIGAAIIVIIFLVGLYCEKRKTVEHLQARLREQENRERQHNADVYENSQAEKKRRDLIEIHLVTNAAPDECEKIYSLLIEKGKYADFFYSNTKKERLTVLRKLKIKIEATD